MALPTDRSYGIIPVCLNDGSEARFLVVQHRAGHWGFPKGHANRDEAPLAAARRELEEETGITDILLLPDVTLEEQYRCRKKGRLTDKTVVYRLGLVKDTRVAVDRDEILDAHWVRLEDLPSRLTFDGNPRLIADVARYLPALQELQS